MSEEFKNQNTIEQPANSTPEDKGGRGGEKMFTQEEVNRIVADRLARERAKGQETVQDQRERELSKREIEVECKDYLNRENMRYGTNYPNSLVELLKPTSINEFKDSLHAFCCVLEDMSVETENDKSKTRRIYASTNHTSTIQTEAFLRSAFGLKRKD